MQKLFRELYGIPGAMPTSWTKMYQMETCPWKWYQVYRNGIEAPQSDAKDPATEIGKSAHSILQGYIENINKTPDINCHYDRFSEHNFNTCVDNLYGTVQSGTRQYRDEIIASELRLADLRRAGWILIPERALYIDPYGACMPWYADYVSSEHRGFMGKLDLIAVRGDEGSIVDYKTEVFTLDRAENVERQLRFYAVMLFGALPRLQTVTTMCDYILGYDWREVARYSRDDLPDMLDALRSEFTQYRDRLLSGNQDPTVSKYCAWCGFIKTCPAHTLEQGSGIWQEAENQESPLPPRTDSKR